MISGAKFKDKEMIQKMAASATSRLMQRCAGRCGVRFALQSELN
jgi:hypothetical protein